ncbi:MAG: hypothetical protein Q4A47_01935 [Erysipelotrichaceae bacterium]|nr:hypothetical protein [Erysipelotrichaceae bacterium]MDO5085575.1 hypothetical protein [Erysipelotrichaceae bacterium]
MKLNRGYIVMDTLLFVMISMIMVSLVVNTVTSNTTTTNVIQTHKEQINVELYEALNHEVTCLEKKELS